MRIIKNSLFVVSPDGSVYLFPYSLGSEANTLDHCVDVELLCWVRLVVS